MLRSAWGIDLTGGSLRAVRVTETLSGVRVDRVHDLPYSEADRRATPLSAHLPEGVQAVLGNFREAARGTLDAPVFVGLPGFGASSGKLELPPVQRGGDAAGILEFELRRTLRGDLDDYVVRASEPKQRRGERTVHWCAHRRTVVATVLSDLRHSGLPVDGLEPEATALGRLARYAGGARSRRVLIQVQRTRTDLVYLHEAGIWTRTIPAGSGDPDSPLSADALDRLVQRIHGEHAGTSHWLPDGISFEKIVLYGDATSVPGLLQRLETAFGLSAATAGSPRGISLRSPLEDSTWQYGTALGLALSALGELGDTASLTPLPRPRRARRGLGVVAAALLACATAFGLLRLFLTADLSEREATLAEIEKTLTWDRLETARELLAQGELAGRKQSSIERRVAHLARQRDLPRRLVEALDLATVSFRLARCAWTVPATGPGRLELEFEVPQGAPDSPEAIGNWVRGSTGLEVADVHTEASPAGDRVIRIVAVSPDLTAGGSAE